MMMTSTLLKDKPKTEYTPQTIPGCHDLIRRLRTQIRISEQYAAQVLEATNAQVLANMRNSSPFNITIEGVPDLIAALRVIPKVTIKITSNSLAANTAASSSTPTPTINTFRLSCMGMSVRICAMSSSSSFISSDYLKFNPTVPLSPEGVLELTNIRFTRVSSRNGGSFRLVVILIDTITQREITRTTSSEVRVVCKGTATDSKTCAEYRLSPEQSVRRLINVGHIIAERLAKYGIITIRDLANYPRRDFEMLKIRSDRGRLDEHGLRGLHYQATSVCEDHQPTTTTCTPTTTTTITTTTTTTTTKTEIAREIGETVVARDATPTATVAAAPMPAIQLVTRTSYVGGSLAKQ